LRQNNTEFALNRARAMHELQLQQPVCVTDGEHILGTAFAVEFMDESGLRDIAALAPQLLLSSARAHFIGIEPQHAVAVIDANGFSLEKIWHYAAGNKNELPAAIAHITPPECGGELITLAKQAGIIPALLWIPHSVSGAVTIDVAALRYIPPVELLHGETAALPVGGAEQTTLTSFRTRYGAAVHLVLTIGDATKTPPLVRVHSSCVTGDLLGSMRCDCGDQLQQALARMKEASSGVLLYLHQEGRGIGISSKLRAYALQEQGLDTFAANQQLGFEEDERDFSLAAHILQALGHTKIRLLTNNPYKIEAFVESAITVNERLPLVADATAHNHAYMEAKKTKRGHW